MLFRAGWLLYCLACFNVTWKRHHIAPVILLLLFLLILLLFFFFSSLSDRNWWASRQKLWSDWDCWGYLCFQVYYIAQDQCFRCGVCIIGLMDGTCFNVQRWSIFYMPFNRSWTFCSSEVVSSVVTFLVELILFSSGHKYLHLHLKRLFGRHMRICSKTISTLSSYG